MKPGEGWLAGGGEMGSLIRSFDWSKTAIGPIETWSPALRMMVGFLLPGSAIRLFYAIQFTEPVPITNLRPCVPASLGSIVHRLLVKDPGQRLVDTAHLIAARDGFLHSWSRPQRATSLIP